MTVEQRKIELRRFYKKERGLIPDDKKVVLDLVIADNVRTLVDKTGATRYFVYNSFGSEVATGEIIKYLLKIGKKVYLPRVEGDIMVAVRVEKDSLFKKSKMNIAEPVGESEEIDNFVALMPCLAIDTSGNRLGYGGGYYDRFLQGKNCIKVALAYGCQIVKRLPIGEYDIPVDYVVRENGLINFANKNISLVD